MPAISSFIEVIQNPGETCADCGEAPATHRLQSISDGVESRAILCKNCLDSRFNQMGAGSPFERGTCEYCGGPDGIRNEDALLKMAGLKAQSRFVCSRCELVRLRFRTEAIRTLQEKGGLTGGFKLAFPNPLDEAERRTREYLRDHPSRANPRVFEIPSMNGLAEKIARPQEPCATCGVAIAAYRVWSQMGEQETEVCLCEQCLPEKSPFINQDFVPEEAACCFCGEPASFTSLRMDGPWGESRGEEYTCVRCARLFSKYLGEVRTPELLMKMKDDRPAGMVEMQLKVEQRVRDHLRDHPE